MPIGLPEGEQEKQWGWCPVEHKECSCCISVEKGTGKSPEPSFVCIQKGFKLNKTRFRGLLNKEIGVLFGGINKNFYF